MRVWLPVAHPIPEDIELEQDLAAYRRTKASDDGGRVSLDELRRELGE
jgi:hypothetical protein